MEVKEYSNKIEVKDEEGDTFLDLESVMWFEVDEKKYFAFTKGKTYELRKTLNELDETLHPAKFFRVNRSAIINLSFFKNYSYWEHDKYLIRMKDDKTEFVIQRTKLKELKKRIGSR